MSTRALFTGSFDPLTEGHLDLIRRASKIFDTLTVGVIVNMSKKPYFTDEERASMIRECTSDLENVTVDTFSGLLADYVNENGFNVVLRGLRGIGDLDYEMTMAQMNDHLFNEGVETLFLSTDPRYSFVSSSLAKEVHGLGGDIEGLVPAPVLREMNKKKMLGGK